MAETRRIGGEEEGGQVVRRRRRRPLRRRRRLPLPLPARRARRAAPTSEKTVLMPTAFSSRLYAKSTFCAAVPPLTCEHAARGGGRAWAAAAAAAPAARAASAAAAHRSTHPSTQHPAPTWISMRCAFFWPMGTLRTCVCASTRTAAQCFFSSATSASISFLPSAYFLAYLRVESREWRGRGAGEEKR